MTKEKQSFDHLKKRADDRVKRNLSNIETSKTQILTCSSDLGVIRNGGRRGSNFGPQAILSSLYKMASHQSKNKFSVAEVAPLNFDQLNETENILPFLNGAPLIQIGGGHDHIYPLLNALNKTYKKITVINIDAHLDTRTDSTFHSGTPFRQFSNSAEGEFHLIQIGIHDFSNPDSNYEKLKNGKMDIISFNELKNETENFSLPCMPLIKKFLKDNYDEKHALVFSLDCDAIDSAIMEGVSAVNHQGLPLFAIEEILENLKKVYDVKIFGIYEYNPVYDNLSEKGSKAIAKLIYQLIEDN